MIFEHIEIRVSNLEKSIEFYTKVLGFNVLRRSENPGEAKLAYLFNEDDLVELLEVRKGSELPVGLATIGMRVDDMDKTTERFKELGVEFTPVHKSVPVGKGYYVPQVTQNKVKRASVLCLHPYWRSTRIRDPDGVDILFFER